MALTIPKVLFGPSQITSSDATYYTSPATTKTTVTRCVFTNVDTVQRTLTVNVVRSGGSVATTNAVISAYPISPGQAYVSPELAGLILDAGDFLSFKASANSAINATGSGYTS